MSVSAVSAVMAPQAPGPDRASYGLLHLLHDCPASHMAEYSSASRLHWCFDRGNAVLRVVGGGQFCMHIGGREGIASIPAEMASDLYDEYVYNRGSTQDVLTVLYFL